MSTLDVQQHVYELNCFMSESPEIFGLLDPAIFFKKDKLMFKICGFSEENSVIPYFDYMLLLKKHILKCKTLMESPRKPGEIPSVELSKLKKGTDPLVQETISKILSKYPDISYEDYLECLKDHVLKCKNIKNTFKNMQESEIDDIQNFLNNNFNSQHIENMTDFYFSKKDFKTFLEEMKDFKSKF